MNTDDKINDEIDEKISKYMKSSNSDIDKQDKKNYEKAERDVLGAIFGSAQNTHDDDLTKNSTIQDDLFGINKVDKKEKEAFASFFKTYDESIESDIWKRSRIRFQLMKNLRDKLRFVEVEKDVPLVFFRGNQQNVFELRFSNLKYEVGPGLYIIIGEGDSGKTYFIEQIAKNLKEKKAFYFIGESDSYNFKEKNDFSEELPVTGSISDLIYLEKVVFKTDVILIDSLNFIMPYNTGFGLEEYGLPKKPFQTMWALDKALQFAGKMLIATLPLDSANALVHDRYFSKLTINTSGVFHTKIKQGSVRYTLRFDKIRKRRISATSADLINEFKIYSLEERNDYGN